MMLASMVVVPEMTSAIRELKRVIKHRDELIGEDAAKKNPILGVCLSSRKYVAFDLFR